MKEKSQVLLTSEVPYSDVLSPAFLLWLQRTGDKPGHCSFSLPSGGGVEMGEGVGDEESSSAARGNLFSFPERLQTDRVSLSLGLRRGPNRRCRDLYPASSEWLASPGLHA